MDGAAAIEMFAVPLMAIALGASANQLGTIGTLRSLTYAAACPFTGRLSDRIGHKRMLLLSCGLTACFYFGVAFASTISLMFLIVPGIGVSVAMFWPSFQAWFSRGKSRGDLLRTMGFFNIAWGLSAIIGPSVGGILYTDNIRMPFYVSIVIVLLSGIFLYDMPAVAFTGTHISDDQSRKGEVYLPIAWIANFTAFFILGVVRYIFPKMAVSIGIDPRPLGFLLSLVAVTQTAVFLLAGLTDRWQYKMAPLLIAQGLALLGVLLIGFGSSMIILGLGLASIGLLIGISFCSSCFYSLFTPSKGGARAGWHEAIVGSGMLFGPFLGGLTAQYFGMRIPYFLCAALIVVATCVQGYIHIHHREYREHGGKEIIVEKRL